MPILRSMSSASWLGGGGAKPDTALRAYVDINDRTAAVNGVSEANPKDFSPLTLRYPKPTLSRAAKLCFAVIRAEGKRFTCSTYSSGREGLTWLACDCIMLGRLVTSNYSLTGFRSRSLVGDNLSLAYNLTGVSQQESRWRRAESPMLLEPSTLGAFYATKRYG